MGKIKKITENELVGGTQSTDVYPVTSVKAVYDESNERLDNILNRRGVVNISTNYNADHIAEVLTLEQAIAKVPSKDRVLGFQGKFLSENGWKSYVFIGDSIADWTNKTKWNNYLTGTDIVQESGEAEDKVMSQKVVSDKLSDLANNSTENITDIISRISSSHLEIVSEDNLLSGYIPMTGGETVIYGTYKHTKKITLKKGECITSKLSGSGVAFISSTIDDINYTPIVAQKESAVSKFFSYIAKEDISLSLCSNSSVIIYTIYSRDEIIKKVKSQKALIIPYDGLIDFDLTKDTLKFPANWLISYALQDDTIKSFFFNEEQIVNLAEYRDQMIITFNTSTKTINVQSYNGNISTDSFVLFEVHRGNGTYKANLPINWYSINGVNSIKKINTDISDMNNDISELKYNVSSIQTKEKQVDWINGYYIDKNGGTPISYSSYDISHPIQLQKGEKVSINIKGINISAISKSSLTSESSIDDITRGNYLPLVELNSRDKILVEYQATENCFITLCREHSSINDNCYISAATMIPSQDILNKIDKIEDKLSCPDFVIEEATKTFERFEKWKGKDKCCIFPIISDLHPYSDDRMYKYITYLIETDKIWGYNFIANLGDFGDDLTYDANGNAVSGDSDNADISKTEEIDYSIIVKAAKRFGDWKGKVMFAQGNHDCVDNSTFAPQTFGRESVWNYLMMPSINRFPNEYIINNEHQCGYYDDNDNKIRFIFLNTSDNQKEDYDKGETRKEYKVTKEQLIWLIDVLKSIKVGYGVVILAHFCINRIGEWKSYPQTRVGQEKWAANGPYYEQGLGRILEGFANKTSGTDNESSAEYQNSNVSWDFTGIDSTCKLIAYVCGDSHFDALLKKDETFVTESGTADIPAGIECPSNGINYLITQSYGKCLSSELHSKARYKDFNHDASQECLIDVVAIKTDKKAVKVFRIGAGGADFDRSFTY